MAAIIDGILADIASIIVLSGAIVVAVTAYFVLKSTFKKDVSQTRQQPAQKAEAGDTVGQPGSNSLVAGIKKLLGRRTEKAAPGSGRALPVQPSVGEGPPALAPEVDLPPLPQNQEAPVAQPAGEGPPALASEVDLPPLPQNQEAPAAESAGEGPPALAPEVDLPPLPQNQEAPAAESAGEGPPALALEADLPPPPEDQEAPADESATAGEPEGSAPEASPEEPEGASEPDDSEVQKQKPEGDDMFSLFTEVTAEESGVSKLAETMEEVDVHGLLEDAQNFKNQLRGS